MAGIRYDLLGMDPKSPSLRDPNESAGFFGEAAKGLQSSLTGTHAGLRVMAGTAAEALGAPEFAQSQYAKAAELEQQAQQQAPRITSYKDAFDSAANLRDYAGGLLGGSAPSIVLGMGAGALARTAAGALVGGTLAQTPLEAADVALKQRHDEQALQQGPGERLGRQVLGGAGSAALQTVVPAAVGGKIVGRGAEQATKQTLKQIAAHNLAAVPEEGFFEGASEALKQQAANNDKPLDWDPIIENAVGGGVAGGALAGAGTVGDALHAAPRKAWIGAKGAAQEGLQAAQEGLSGAQEALAPHWQGLKAQVDAGMTYAKQALPDAPQSVKDLGDYLKTSASEQIAAAKQAYQDILAADDVPGEIKAQAQAAGQNLMSRANRAWLYAADQARSAAGAVQEAVQPAMSDIGSRLRGLTAREDDTAERLARGEDLVDNQALAGASTEQADGLLKQAGEKAAAWTRDTLGKLAERADLSAEQRQAVGDALAAPYDAAKRMGGAAVASALKAKDAFATRLSALHQGLSEGFKEGRGGAKKSMDFSGLDGQIAKTVAPMLQERFPQALDDPKLMSQLGSTLRMLGQSMAEGGDAKTKVLTARLSDLLGDDLAQSTMAAIEPLVTGGDRAKNASYFAAMNEQLKEDTSRASLAKVIGKYTSNEAGARSGYTGSPDALAKELLSWARGEGTENMSRAQIEHGDARVKQFLEQQFGTKASHIYRALEREAQLMKGKSVDMGEGTAAEHTQAAEEGTSLDYGDRQSVGEAATAKAYRGGGKRGNVAVQQPGAYRSEFGNESVAERVMKDAQAGGQAARFVTLRENPELFEQLPAFKAFRTKTKKQVDAQFDAYHQEAQAAGLKGDEAAQSARSKMAEEVHRQVEARKQEMQDKGLGMVEVSDFDPGDRLTPDELNKVRLDTDAHASSPSRIEVNGDTIVDAVKLTQAMKRKLPFSEFGDQSALHRMAEAYLSGLANLMAEHGRFPVSGKTVIGKIGDRTITAADAVRAAANSDTARNLDGRADPKDTTLDSVERRTSQLELQISRVEESLDKLYQLDGLETNDGALNRIDYLEGRLQKLNDAHGKLTARLEGLRNQDALARSKDELGKTDVGKDENIHWAAGEHGEGDALEHRVNMDGSAVYHGRGVSQRDKVEALRSVIGRLSGATTERDGKQFVNRIAQAVGRKAAELFGVHRLMSAQDQARFNGLALLNQQPGQVDVAGSAEIVNPLHAKYASLIADPGTYDRDHSPRSRITKDDADRIDKQTAEKRAMLANAKAAREGTPDPKAVAAKKAAFLQRAASGDEALLKELAASDDAKGLQRAAQALIDANQYGAALDTIDRRLSELVQNPDVAYGLQTKKYSLERAMSEDDLFQIETALYSEVEERGHMFADPAAFESDAYRALGVVKNPNTGEQVSYGMDLGAVRALVKKYDLPTTNYWLTQAESKKSNQRATSADPLSAKGLRQVQDAIHTMLGDSVLLETPFLAHAGEFLTENGEDIIRVSAHALNPTSVAYHESLHAFFKQLREHGTPEAIRTLELAAQKPAVMRRMRELLAHSPEALGQLGDAEERAAYLFQFWANGDEKLNAALGEKATGLFAKIADFFRRVLGIWSNDQRALHIMEAFSSGGYKTVMGDSTAVRKLLVEQGRNRTLERLGEMAKPFTELGEQIVGAGSANLRDSGIPALGQLADMVKRRLTDEGRSDAGYLPASRLARTDLMNRLAGALEGADKEHVDEALQALLRGEKATGKAGVVQLGVRKILDDTHAYLTKAGVKVGDLGLGKDYFPRRWDAHYLSKHKDEFLAMAAKYPDWKDPEATYNRLINADGSEMPVVSRPGMSSKKERVLGFISAEDAAPFMSQDLVRTMDSYLTQATRRAEWARRFGDDNAYLGTLLRQAKEQGATPQQIDYAKKYVEGVNGTLGDNLNPTLRRYMGNMIVYQNIRLLPLAIFSSVVDPMGILVRGGKVGDAWGAFKRGVREIPKGLRGDTAKDTMTQLAEDLGVIDNAALSSSLGALYTQGAVSDSTRKWNDRFFRYNLMEQFNTSMRVAATEAALKFMQRHADGKASQHSVRWMHELGVQPGDVKVVNGRVATTVREGLSEAQAARVKRAVNLWVDGAVLRPDAADKPVWMNDPHWMLVSHLKQFVYAFHHTILDRVVHEAKHGNAGPVLALASYVPIMLAADLAKGVLQGMGDQPEWKKNWTAGDYTMNAVERAGLFGVGQFAVDAMHNVQRGGSGVGALTGPTIEQMGDAVAVLGGRSQFGPFAIKAMPANTLYSGALGAGGEDPKMVD